MKCFRWKLLPLMAGLLAASTGADAVNSNHVQVVVKGTVAGETCTVVGGSSQTVNLGDVGVAILASSNSAWVWIPFTIGLEHCPIGMNKATITFNGEPDPDNSQYFKNTAISTHGSVIASNVAIEIVPLTGYDRVTNGSQLVTVVSATTHQADYSLKARMITPTGRASPGIVKGHIDYTVEYQ